MARYDSGWVRRYGRDFGHPTDLPNRTGGGAQWGGPGPRGRLPRGPGGGGPYEPYGHPAYERGSYERGVYGGGYPGLREYPGPQRPSGGYDAPFANGTFLPEEAYRRHPEYDRPPRHVSDRWPDGPAGQGGPGLGREMDDGDVQQFVRESLYGDSWLDADRIQVEVDDGVVTLRGEVRDYMEARYAWDDAWESPGVRGVVNLLTVTTGSDTEE